MIASGRSTPPRRVRVTSPRRTARVAASRSRYRDLEEHTGVGEVYVESLIRAQRRLAAALLVTLTLVLAAVPAAAGLARWMGLDAVTTLVGWAGLAVLVPPAAWILTHWYIRSAERLESEFADLMDLP